MKKDKSKSIRKIARKTAKTSIRTTLLAELKKITAKFSQSSKSLDEEIEKGAKKLAKKLSKKLKFEAVANTETGKKQNEPEIPKQAKITVPAAAIVKVKATGKKNASATPVPAKS